MNPPNPNPDVWPLPPIVRAAPSRSKQRSKPKKPARPEKSKPLPDTSTTSKLSARAYAIRIGVNISTPNLWRIKAGWSAGTFTFEEWEKFRASHGKSTMAVQESKVDVVEKSLDRESKTTEKRLREVELELGDRRRLEAAVLANVERLEVPTIKYVPKVDRKLSPATPCLMIGDLHAGHDVAPLSLLADRFQALRQKFGGWVDCQRHAHTCRTCHVFGMGDYIEGGLRDSARQSNSSQEPQQALGVANLMASFLNDISTQFDSIAFHMLMVDNHSRLDEKMNFEQAVSRSWNPIIESIIRGRLEGNERITIEAPWDFACHVKVENTRFLLIHGNGIRMVRRTPYYGIEDRIVMEKANRQGTPTEFDIMCLGHFHHVGEGQSWFMNPPMVGTTGYDRACGRETTSAQTAFLVSPTHVRPFDKITFEL